MDTCFWLVAPGQALERPTQGLPTGIIPTCWLFICFLFMHQHTVPRVVDAGRPALVTAHVTATASSSRLTRLLRLLLHDENHLTILSA